MHWILKPRNRFRLPLRNSCIFFGFVFVGFWSESRRPTGVWWSLELWHTGASVPGLLHDTDHVCTAHSDQYQLLLRVEGLPGVSTTSERDEHAEAAQNSFVFTLRLQDRDSSSQDAVLHGLLLRGAVVTTRGALVSEVLQNRSGSIWVPHSNQWMVLSHRACSGSYNLRLPQQAIPKKFTRYAARLLAVLRVLLDQHAHFHRRQQLARFQRSLWWPLLRTNWRRRQSRWRRIWSVLLDVHPLCPSDGQRHCGHDRRRHEWVTSTGCPRCDSSAPSGHDNN